MENKGQVVNADGARQPQVLFSCRKNGVAVYLNKNGITYQLNNAIKKVASGKGRADDTEGGLDNEQWSVSTARFEMVLENANMQATVRKEKRRPYYENFYLAHCPEGITHVAAFEQIVYENIYPGIDWVVYLTPDQHIKYDFIVRPGGDPGSIRLRYRDADGIDLARDGSLSIRTALGTITEQAPVIRQEGAIVKGQFVLKGNEVRFGLESYDRSKPLVIDPEIVWSTYFLQQTGAPVLITIDHNNDVILSGRTLGTTPLSSLGGFQPDNAGGLDGFFAKFDPQGNPLYATYYGGESTERLDDCKTDQLNNIYIAGTTASHNGIAYNGYKNVTDATVFREDAYLAKFDAAGTRIWGTYYGGPKSDRGHGVAIDNDGNVYLSGETISEEDIAFNGFMNSFVYAISGTVDWAYNAFLVKFNSAGTPQWGTYFASTGGFTHGKSCVTDAQGNVYLYGMAATDGLGYNSFQVHMAGAADVYLAKFNTSGNRLWCTYFGGSQVEREGNCSLDQQGNIYIAGLTESTNNIGYNGYINTVSPGSIHAFLARFNPQGQRIWGTFHNGWYQDYMYGIGCFTSPDNHVYLAGNCGDDPSMTYNAFQPGFGGGSHDGFVCKFDGSGQRVWSSYFGGTGDDEVLGVAAADDGSLYLSGLTSSNNIAFNGYDGSYSGSGADPFLAKVLESKVTVGTSFGIQTLCPGSSFDVPFSTTAAFGPGNVFTVQLSDPSGSFSNPLAIGSVAAQSGPGVISCSLPSTLPGGNGYRIRIASSVPPDYSPDNGFDMTIGMTAPPEAIDTAGCDSVLFEGVTYRESVLLNDTLKNTSGCDSLIRNIHITVSHLELSLLAAPDDTVYSGERLRLYTEGVPEEYSIVSWSPQSMFPLQHSYEQYLTPSQSFTVTVAGQSAAGCNDTATLDIRLLPFDYALLMPNSFSPNGDGRNDLFKPEFGMKRGCTIADFKIFDRLGKLVYKASNDNTGWNGNYPGGKAGDMGVYFWRIDIRFDDGKHLQLKGDVTLLR